MASNVVDHVVRVRFEVFLNNSQGPFLSYCLVPNDFVPANFSDRSGAQFRSSEEMVEALDNLGLPGREIFSSHGNKVYSLTHAQMETLGIAI